MEPINHMLSDWLVQVLGDLEFTVSWIASDASSRQYCRVYLLDCTYVVMLNGLDEDSLSSLERFITISEVLKEKGVLVPEILSVSPGREFVLLSDLGSTQYLQRLNEESAELLYRDALGVLFKIQKRIGDNSELYQQIALPVMDQQYMQSQIDNLFWEWFIYRFLGLILPEAKKSQLSNSITTLIEFIQTQPKVFTHLDFHSRNLMVMSENNPGVLDFQDAMWGPITYDLASLFQDCYISWPQARQEAWIRRYYVRLINSGAVLLESQKTDFETFLAWFYAAALQRHLKNLGIFARLHLREGKSAYLHDIPTLLENILLICETHPNLKALGNFFQETLCGAFREKMQTLFLEQPCER